MSGRGIRVDINLGTSLEAVDLDTLVHEAMEALGVQKWAVTSAKVTIDAGEVAP